MNAAGIIAAKEFRDGLRNRWVAATALVLAALALGLAFLGTAPSGEVEASRLTATVVSLASLSIFLVPLIALMLSFDAIIGEIERGTMLLLLSYPVARWQVVWGKFLGQAGLLAVAILLGYGSAGVTLIVVGTEPELAPLALLIASSVMLGAAFLAIGTLLSAMVRERATAAGLAVGVWLVLVLLFDLGLLAVLAATEGRAIPAGLFRWLMLANPTDAFRLLNLSGLPATRELSGLAGLADEAALPLPVLAASLAAWVALPLLAAQAIFARRQL